MGSVVLHGLDGSNPLAFLAALGLLRITSTASLSWCEAGGFRAQLHGVDSISRLVAVVARDVHEWPSSQWLARWNYLKKEKNGVKMAQGLRMPVAVYRKWALDRASRGDDEALSYAAALVCECVGETLDAARLVDAQQYEAAEIPFERGASLSTTVAPTFLDFTSRNKQLVAQAELVRRRITTEQIASSLTGTGEVENCDITMGWDPAQDAPGALFPRGTPPFRPALEWLAFRALPLLPTFYAQNGQGTTACRGRRKDGQFVWAVWGVPVSCRVAASLLRWPSIERLDVSQRRALGILAIFSSELAKAADGYEGIFAPSAPT